MRPTRSARSIVIELLGLPGSGKSTLFAHAKQLLDARGFDFCAPGVPSVDELLRHYSSRQSRFFAASMDHLEQSARLRSVAGHGDTERLLRTHAQLWFTRCYLVESARNQPGVHLLEEGTVHELWRHIFLLRGTRASRTAAKHLWRLMPHCDSSVLIQAGAVTAVRRIAGKPKLGPINKMLASGSPDDEIWRAASDSYSSLARRVRTRRTTLSLDNDNDDSLSVNAARLARFVLDLNEQMSP